MPVARVPISGPDSLRIHGFPPLLPESPRVLILGSMPSERSLVEHQYYGHPRNRFWPIMGRLFGAGPELPYAPRCQRLKDARVAVWDVLAACHRSGSLDADIQRGSEQVNPIDQLVAEYPGLQRLVFNGQAAAKTFDRHLHARRGDWPESMVLPSTSPANARWSLEQLTATWQQALALS